MAQIGLLLRREVGNHEGILSGPLAERGDGGGKIRAFHLQAEPKGVTIIG